LFILLVFLVFLVNLNYTWEMSTWLSFFINLHHYTGITKQNAFYGQAGIFQRFVRKFLAIMMMIYGHKPLFGAFVRKTWSKTP